MELFPAIDLRGGAAVRLLRGDYKQMTVYSTSPVEVAKSFAAAGARYLHLVDLDGAKDGGTPNCELIAQIVSESGLLTEVGGGIRNMQAVEHYLNAGARRVIIGSAAVTDPDFLREALLRFGEKIAVGVDLKDGCVAIHGWTETSRLDGYAFIESMQELGVKTIICTDISKDGAMQGVNAELYRELKRRFSLDIIASGGVSGLSDLETLSSIGVRGAILGKALYTGGIKLEEAIARMKEAESV
ncbi:MAG: 1-(5-phosphoribosyl)-5-[(5-phosphoribosylamino)methylideneamino]imidazole-4-carboxamide isomerase [Oscillospiraceae bacterium]|nr:1-(5-phosphoribosyl)-5-[(5-phosphoribosylamino)methylideneamino]imidazole-4-carboxamide isomerase [Oscillospiraceae bacterium]